MTFGAKILNEIVLVRLICNIRHRMISETFSSATATIYAGKTTEKKFFSPFQLHYIQHFRRLGHSP